VTVVNRFGARGQALVELLAARTRRGRAVVWSDGYAVPGATDLLVNATSIGLPPDVAARPALGLLHGRPAWWPATSSPPQHALFAGGAASRCTRGGWPRMLVYQAASGSSHGPEKAAPVSVMRDRAVAGVAGG